LVVHVEPLGESPSSGRVLAEGTLDDLLGNPLDDLLVIALRFP
jgi:hypothetical protein